MDDADDNDRSQNIKLKNCVIRLEKNSEYRRRQTNIRVQRLGIYTESYSEAFEQLEFDVSDNEQPENDISSYNSCEAPEGYVEQLHFNELKHGSVRLLLLLMCLILYILIVCHGMALE